MLSIIDLILYVNVSVIKCRHLCSDRNIYQVSDNNTPRLHSLFQFKVLLTWPWWSEQVSVEVVVLHPTQHLILNCSPFPPSSSSSSSCSCVFCASCFSCGVAHSLPWHSCHLSQVPHPHLYPAVNIID